VAAALPLGWVPSCWAIHNTRHGVLRNLTIVNAGAPDHAGIRGESHVQSRRQPTAFIRYPDAQEWKPNVRKELADVREGMHKVLDALLDSPTVAPREKAVLELLQNTGARLHEIVNLSIGGYRNDGIAGEARVINKGSHGREIKTIYFARNPKVQHALNRYIEQIRPRHDLAKRGQLADLDNHEPLFLSQRGTPYRVKDFYYHWYRHYLPLASQCPVRFSPHDIRHLFITEFLIFLRSKHGYGTDHFNSELYLSEREAFSSEAMGWHSPKTIDIYDHSRDKEGSLGTLAMLQKSYEERRYVSLPLVIGEPEEPSEIPGLQSQESLKEGQEIVWIHDHETLAWIQRLQQRIN
jgi:integrase